MNLENFNDKLLEALAKSKHEEKKKVCPDCNGSGVYQEYDEYDRYTVHSCATCDGSGEIACQSVKSEEVAEAIEQLKYAREQDREFDDGTFVDSLDLAIAALQAYQPWIPVSDRFPEREEHYLCYEGSYQAIFVAYYSTSGWQRPLYRETTVTHWKPLPEPPKGE